MNVNAASFAPQGSGNDKASGSGSAFRSSVSAPLGNEGKKSNQRAPVAPSHAKTFSNDQQRSLSGRGKNQRQSSSKRSNQDREQGRTGNGSRAVGSSSTLVLADSTFTALNDKAKGNKKNQVSLNHLLNFSFPVREEPQNTGPVRRRRNANYQPFNKDKFINANDYEVFTMDPDVRVRWEDIEQVLIAVPQSCPICLQPPVAPRITKCGHVYCFPCILHYLALSESNKAWRKCPICWDAIYEKDLKSVRPVLEELNIYDQGEKEIAKQIASRQEVHLEMRLIQRSVNSTLALPRSNTFPLPEAVLPQDLQGQPPLEFYPDAILFSRLMVTTLARILSELERDNRAIEFSMEEAKSYDPLTHSEEIVFFEMAKDKIRERQEKIREESKFFPKPALDRERILRQYFEQAPPRQTSAEISAQQPIRFDRTSDTEVPFAAMEPDALADRVQTLTIEPEDTPAPIKLGHQDRVPNQLTTMYYFYQAANGHHLYLQPLDIRILKQHFQTYECFPDSIMVKVLGIEETSLTEEVRKKCKYLGHLPLGCEVSFLDVALESIVGDEGIKPFETEVKLRRSKRKEKEAREERERIEREHKMNPPKARQDDFFANDPFFQSSASLAASGGASSGQRAEMDLQEAIRLSQAALEESMPTLSEASARANRRSSIPTGSRNDPSAQEAGHSGHAEPWTSSFESNAGLNGPSTVWGTPSVPVNRSQDDYDDYFDEHDYEPDVVVKRGKKKVTVLLTNNSRRSR